MNGFAASKLALSHEEKLLLIDEKSFSDIESESGSVDLESRFSTQQWITTARAYCSTLRFSSCGSTIKRTAVFLLPSFIQSRLSRDRVRNDKIGPTAYLDGMRGLAALFVFFCHYLYGTFKIAEGWGHNDENYQIWKLPFIRLLISGPSMVCLFFVISGYALSLKPLKQIRSRQFDGFAATMSSFVFRRAFRLFLPTASSTFLVMILLQLGAYEVNRDFATDKSIMRNVVEYHPVRVDGFFRQFTHWFWEMFNFIHVFGWEKFGGSTGYDVHLWTIPVEYRCSLYLFLGIFGLARLRTGLRFFCLAGLMWFCLRNDHWELLLFYAGMGLAEMDLIRGAHNPPPAAAATSVLPFEEKPVPKRRNLKPFLLVPLSILALYFMSEPDAGPDGVLGWEFLGSLIPEYFSDKYRYWQMIGGIMFVFCVARLPAWQVVFNTSFVQYFGRISYAIYLMHGPVIHTIGYSIEKWAWSITGTEGYALNIGFILASVFNIPLIIWAADVFWRAVDAPTVRFTKWLEIKCTFKE